MKIFLLALLVLLGTTIYAQVSIGTAIQSTSARLDVVSATVVARTHIVGLSTNTLTSDVNGVSVTAPIINERLLGYSDKILNNRFFEMPYTITSN